MTDNEHIQLHIAQKFQIVKKLGEGAYGHVWKAKCKQTGKFVALKKIFDAFQHATDSQRTFRQISILKQLSHSHIISLYEVIEAKNNRDIYLVFEYMESDLYHLIYEGNLQKIHVKYILYQILLGLHYLHHSKLIHRDLKPSNILINSDCSVKICDFGLVRYLNQESSSQNVLTEGIATRWYRAPQVLLGSNSYNWQADMWSLGCIAAQILIKNPLFPGKCTTDQLEKILQFTGKPSKSDIQSLKSEMGQMLINEISGLKVRRRQTFSASEDKDAIDLISKLLEFNPQKRLTTQQAIRHKYFNEFFHEKDLDAKKEEINLLVDENIKLKTEDYIKIIKEKFTQKSEVQSRKKNVSESPKCFSDLKRVRNGTGSKSKLKYQSKQKKQKGYNLFEELCREKSKKKISPSKNSSRKKSTNKENIQNNSLSNGTRTPLMRFADQQKVGGSFHGLRKISRLPK